jgi:LysM repeat protein
MSSRRLLTSREVVLLIVVNAMIAALISLAIGLLLNRSAQVAVAPTATAMAPIGATGVVPTQAVSTAAAAAAPLVHIVSAGDTVTGLALQYDVPAEDIIAANNLVDPDRLQVGMELIIPISGVSEIVPTWTPPPAPTDTPIPFDPPSARLTATALAEQGILPTSSSGDGSPAPGGFQVEITDVINPGNVDREAVVIYNRGKEMADMRGWTLSDTDGNSFTFSDLRLWPGGSVTVNTRAGQDGSPAFNFYWNKLQPLWSRGEEATLEDGSGTVISRFAVE